MESMIRFSPRILGIFAIAGLVVGVFNLAKVGSSPAQDVAPPGCSEPGQAGDSGVSAGSPGSGDPNGTVSSVVNPTEGEFEWTLERMLLATPMPMTQEERTFLSNHPPLEKLLEWKQADFDKYISDPMGLKHAAEEGVRWRDLSAMLKRQSQAGAKFFDGDKAVQPDLRQSTQGGDFESLDYEKFQAGLKKDSRGGFAKMSQWRQEIKVLSARVEALRKKAAGQGKTEEFERAIDDSGST